MCKETAGCYNPALGACNKTLLFKNMEDYNSPCAPPEGSWEGDWKGSPEPKCWSGSPIPMAMKGHFQVNVTDDDPIFLACDLRLPSIEMRTRTTWDYYGCLGGPNNECADGNSGWICSECATGTYRAGTGRCVKCTDPDFSRTLMISLLCVFFFLLIPLIFTFFFYSVSDKSASQNMVYPRLVVDLCVVLFLVKESLFQYWPSELLPEGHGLDRTFGKSFVEKFNSLYMECAFSWGFSSRYISYLLLPQILMVGLSFQVGIIYFLYKFSDGDSVGQGSVDDSFASAGGGQFDATNVNIRGKSACLNKFANAIVARLPNGSTPRGGRIAWAVPRDEMGWKRFWNHAIQVYLLMIILLYITLVNYSLTVFDCSRSNKHHEDFVYMEEIPTIACSLSNPEWVRLALVAGTATIAYTLAIPTMLLTIFIRNRESALRGDMSYMQRFGFLLKPYKQECYYWEIVNIFRKAFLSCLVRMTTSQPFICGCSCAAVMFLIIYHQAGIRPYKYEKHNDCALFILWVGCLNFLSSIIFISDLPTFGQKQRVLYCNAVLVSVALIWAIGGAIKDNFNFFNFRLFISKCESAGRAESEREKMWLEVDRPGLVRLKLYDLLVLRHRYAHYSLREVRTDKLESSATAAQADSSAPARTVRVEGEDVPLGCIKESQWDAHLSWQKFHRGFAKFVARIEPDRIDSNFLEQVDRMRKHCPGRPGGLSALSVSLCKSVFYGAFVWACRVLMYQKWRFSARAVREIDEDGSGTLDREEVRLMLDRVRRKAVDDAELDVAMDDMGVGVDGEVTFQTFEKWCV
jgi:hypothetical protein